MFPCGICLLIHLNTFERLRVPKIICNSCNRERGLKRRNPWRITGAVESREAEILSSPRKWVFPCIHERQLTGASGSWEWQAASLFSTAENSAIWIFPKSISYSPPKEKAWNPLNFIYCTAQWQAFHNTWTHAFQRANCSEELHTWLLIPSPLDRFLGERESTAPEHISPAPGIPAVPLLQPSHAASAAPLPASTPTESAAEQCIWILN